MNADRVGYKHQAVYQPSYAGLPILIPETGTPAGIANQIEFTEPPDTKKAHTLRLLFCLALLYEPSGLNGLGLAGAPSSGLSGVAGLNGLGFPPLEELAELAGFMGLNGFAAEDDSCDDAELAELIAK